MGTNAVTERTVLAVLLKMLSILFVLKAESLTAPGIYQSLAPWHGDCKHARAYFKNKAKNMDPEDFNLGLQTISPALKRWFWFWF